MGLDFRSQTIPCTQVPAGLPTVDDGSTGGSKDHLSVMPAFLPGALPSHLLELWAARVP
jgi:hypothetical protein